MTSDLSGARQAIQNAREALRNGDKGTARHWAELAASLAPELEEPWLVLAAVASPRASIAYLNEALKINPNSRRARAGVQWANERLRTELEKPKQTQLLQPLPPPATTAGKARIARRSSFPSVLLTIVILVVGWAALSGGSSPAFAFIHSNIGVPTASQEPSWSDADIVKPTYTLTPTATFTPTPTFTLTPTPTPTFPPTDTPLPTYTPYPQPTYAPPQGVPHNGERWIDVNLSTQRVYAFEGDIIVNSFIVSTGTWRYPTVTGQYNIYVKYRYADMRGPGYFLPDVPYTMYYYTDYALHGTYWHNNFGTPMSHGCINLTIADAGWLFNWASVSTLVNIHY